MGELVIDPLLVRGWVGVREAWAVLLHEDAQRVLAQVCRRWQSGHQDAEELAQGVLERVIDRAQRHGGLRQQEEVHEPRAFLRRTFERFAKDLLRRNERHVDGRDSLTDEEDGSEHALVDDRALPPSAPLEARRAFAAARGAIEGLKANLRVGVMMVHIPEHIEEPHIGALQPREVYPDAPTAWARLLAARPLDEDDGERRAHGTFILWGGDHADLATFQRLDQTGFHRARDRLRQWVTRGLNALPGALSAEADRPRPPAESPTAERP